MCDDFPDFSTLCHEVVDVMSIQTFQDFLDLLFDPGIFQKVAVGIGSNGKTVGYFYPFAPKFLVHLSKRSVFPAD